MNREERKAYKASERAKLQNGLVFITRETPKNKKVHGNHSKLVKRAYAERKVIGSWNQHLQMFVVPKLKHKFKIVEIKK